MITHRLLAWLVVIALCVPITSLADTVTGRIKYISKKASTIQIDQKGKSAVVRFDKNTRYVNATGIKELGTKDLIEIEFVPGQPATTITKKVFALPTELEIGVTEVEKLIKGSQCLPPGALERGVDKARELMKEKNCLIVDARPTVRYLAGHIPNSISIFAKDLPDKLDMLPQDKSKLVVFYCGGPTCPFTGQSIQIAQKHGHTNLKGFQAGMPAWKKANKPVHATASWLAENLDQHHVVIDVRPRSESTKQHIKSAVAMPAEEFNVLRKNFIKEKQPARLPGVSDKRAPIIVYADAQEDESALAAFAELRKWKYKNVAVLEGGFTQWVKDSRPVASGPAATEITFVRKLKKGAIPRDEFVTLTQQDTGIALVDVRSNKEVTTGMLRNAVHIPLNDLEASLDKLPREEEIITYCSNGIRSEIAYELLINKGFSNVRFLDETLRIASDGSYVFD